MHWLRKEKEAFTSGFRGTSIMRERAISVIVEYVPVLHSPDVLAENRKFEQDSGLEEGTLRTTRWMKPTQWHIPGQWAAHLITHFQTMEAANHEIREGIDISGKIVWARHLWKEPRRCLKCQSLTMNHLVAKCDVTSHNTHKPSLICF